MDCCSFYCSSPPSTNNPGLYASPKGAPKTALTHESDLSFQFDTRGNTRITFTKDAQGQFNESILPIREREMRGKTP